MCAGARKRLQNGIEEPPRSIVPAMSQHQAPASAPAKAPAPAPPARRAIEKLPEQPHVQFPDDSPYMARGTPLPFICQVKSCTQ